MILVISTILCALLALAHSEGFHIRERSNFTGRVVLPDGREPNLNEYGGIVARHLVLLIENDSYIGTGLMVTHNTIITPSKNLKDNKYCIEISTSTKFGRGRRTLVRSKSYDGPLNVAQFYPPISGNKFENPTIPIITPNITFTTQIEALVAGFASAEIRIHRKRVELLYDLDNAWYAVIGIQGDKPRNSYYPRIGDVLVTKGYILGILVDFLRNLNQEIGQFYFPNHPYTISSDEPWKPLNIRKKEEAP